MILDPISFLNNLGIITPILIGFLLCVLGLIILNHFGFPLYSDPFSLPDGKTEELRVTLKDPIMQKKFSEWRDNMLSDLRNRHVNQIYIHSGEFNKILRNSAEFALSKGVTVTVISGPLPKNDNEKNKILLEYKDKKIQYGDKFKIFVLDQRSENHFCILGPNLLLEEPHHIDSSERLYLGIWNAYPQYTQKLIKHFEEYSHNSTELDIQKIAILLKSEVGKLKNGE